MIGLSFAIRTMEEANNFSGKLTAAFETWARDLIQTYEIVKAQVFPFSEPFRERTTR